MHRQEKDATYKISEVGGHWNAFRSINITTQSGGAFLRKQATWGAERMKSHAACLQWDLSRRSTFPLQQTHLQE